MYNACMPNKVDDMTEQIFCNHYPLHLACRDGDEDRVKALLQSGHDVYEEDGLRGWTPMHWAAASGSLKCLMVLSEHGVSIDAANHRINQTPAHIAAQHSMLHCLHWLMTCGAATAHQDNMGETPLHKAVRGGNLDCVALLLSHGSPLSLQNHNGHTPLDIARLYCKVECARYLERALTSQHTGFPLQTPSSSALPSNSSPDILMNGEPIYVNQGGHTSCTVSGGDLGMEVEDAAPFCTAASAPMSGIKRSHDDGDENCFKRQRCFEPLAIDKSGTSTNNNVLSSYNAVLAMSVEPVKETEHHQNYTSQVHASSLPFPGLDPEMPFARGSDPYIATSSVLEHCRLLQAEYGYDSSFFSSIFTSHDHGS